MGIALGDANPFHYKAYTVTFFEDGKCRREGMDFLYGFPKGKEKAKARERFLGEIER